MENNHNFIYAKKGSQTAKFTSFVWKNMGVNKNGWEIDTEKMREVYGDIDLTTPKKKTGQTGTVKSAGNVVSKDIQYKNLVEQGKGFEKDGKLAEAMGKYSQALTIKTTKALEKKVATLEKKLGEEIAKQAEENAIAAADEEFDNQNYEGAKELYLAVPNQELKHVKDRLVEIEDLLLG